MSCHPAYMAAGPSSTVQLDPYLILLSLVFLGGAEDTWGAEALTWTCVSPPTEQEVPHLQPPLPRDSTASRSQAGQGLQALWFSASGPHSVQPSGCCLGRGLVLQTPR